MVEPLLSVQEATKTYGPGCPGRNTDGCPLSNGDPATNLCTTCGSLIACADVSFNVYPGEVVGIVGESGSGKTTVLRSLYLDIVPTSGAAFLSVFEQGDRNIFKVDRSTRRYIRNYLMGIVYQEARTGLNLLVTAGGNVAERLLAADWRRVGDIRAKALDYLSRTEVPVDRIDDFPAFFSSGMQQRVQIAKALSNSPNLVLLDEPTTGLDVSVQAGVLDLIRDIRRDYGITIVIVSHDLGVIGMLADRTMVMRNGRVVESGLTDQILEDPQYPYTQLLVSSTL